MADCWRNIFKKSSKNGPKTSKNAILTLCKNRCFFRENSCLQTNEWTYLGQEVKNQIYGWVDHQGIPAGVIFGLVGVGGINLQGIGAKILNMFIFHVQNCILDNYKWSRIEIEGQPFNVQNMGVRRIPPKW